MCNVLSQTANCQIASCNPTQQFVWNGMGNPCGNSCNIPVWYFGIDGTGKDLSGVFVANSCQQSNMTQWCKGIFMKFFHSKF